MKIMFIAVIALTLTVQALAATCYVTMSGELRWGVYQVFPGSEIRSYDSNTGLEGTTYRSPDNAGLEPYGVDSISLYGNYLTATAGQGRKLYTFDLTDGSVTSAWTNRPWAVTHDQATGELYTFQDGPPAYYPENSNNPWGVTRFSDNAGVIVATAVLSPEQGYYGGADIEINGDFVYYTTTDDNMGGRYVWKLPVGFDNFAEPIPFFDTKPVFNDEVYDPWNPNYYIPDSRGIAFDTNGNLFLVCADLNDDASRTDKVIKIDSSGNYVDTLISSGIDGAEDIDFFNNEFYVSCYEGVKVFDVNGNYDRTFGPTGAHYTAFEAVPEPSTLFALASSVIGLAGLKHRRLRK